MLDRLAELLLKRETLDKHLPKRENHDGYTVGTLFRSEPPTIRTFNFDLHTNDNGVKEKEEERKASV